MTLRIVSLLLALVFARSVVVQANDPDPLVWMTVYGLATAMSIAAFLDRLPAVLPKAAALLFGLGLAFRITALPATTVGAFSLTTMGTPEIEEVREAWGLLTCLLWAVVLSLGGRPGEKG